MRIQITAKGIVSVTSWSNDVRIDEVSLSKQIADAIRSNGVPKNPFADVTVEINIQEPNEMVTTINGKLPIPEDSLPTGSEEES